MSWEEYKDLIEKANNKQTKYVVYSLDGVGEDRKEKHKEFIDDSLILMEKMKEIFLNINPQILVQEKPISLNKKTPEIPYYTNPNIIRADLISFYFYNDLISEELFKDVFNKAYEYTSKQFRYHLSKCNYETNDYGEGNKLLYVGYALSYINDSKHIRIDTLGNKKNTSR